MGVDLVDFYRGEISLRKMCLFARYLDKDSKVATEMRSRQNLDEGVWSDEMYVLAGIFNGVMAMKYYTEGQLWARQKKKAAADEPKPPEPIRPPGWRPEKVRMSSDMELHQFFKGAIRHDS
jgi:hypothetical protein